MIKNTFFSDFTDQGRILEVGKDVWNRLNKKLNIQLKKVNLMEIMNFADGNGVHINCFKAIIKHKMVINNNYSFLISNYAAEGKRIGSQYINISKLKKMAWKWCLNIVSIWRKLINI